MIVSNVGIYDPPSRPVNAMVGAMASIFGANMIGLWTAEDIITDGAGNITSWPGRIGGILTPINGNSFRGSSLNSRAAANYGAVLNQAKSLRWSNATLSKAMIAVAGGCSSQSGNNYEAVAYCIGGTANSMIVRDATNALWAQTGGAAGMTHYMNGVASEVLPTSGAFVVEGVNAASAGTGVGVLGTTATFQGWEAPVAFACSLAAVPSAAERSAYVAVLRSYYGI